MPSFHLGLYGYAVGTLLALKLLLSIRRRRAAPREWRAPAPMNVAAIITVYNEDPAALHACLDSLLQQTRRPQSVTVVDDCSADRTAADLAAACARYFWAAGIDMDVVRQPINRGKRHGIAAGVQLRGDADIYLCIDSDTVLERDAVEQLLKPFSRHRVHAATALVLARNRTVNLLTRLIDMRYVNAFLGERVAYSRLGSVLCVCGSMAAYRGWVVRRYLDDFLGQTFLGRPATAGDDRRLTYYALLEGQAVIQPAAVARTDVPERLGHYLRQQLRWTKSFIREGLLMAGSVRMAGRVCWWLNLLELATWTAFTSALIVALAVFATSPHLWTAAASYAAYVCAASWLRSLHYLRGAAGVPRADRLMTFALAPTYALMNIALLIPLRLWAIATIRDGRWGTRQRVELAPSAA